ncbi:Nuclear receptor coactivator 5 [Papilio xuthus]|nr:Nuclear receptor coactivator 5 [Papilio xuthus]
MKNRATAHLRIYVGGITERATLEELYEHFSPFGQITGLIFNRSFGFVQFENEASAQEAIAKGDGSIFQGKSLCVRAALADRQKRDTDYTPASNINMEAASSNDNYASNDGSDEQSNSNNYGNYGDQRQSNTDYREEETDEGYGKGYGEGYEANESREQREVREHREPRESREPRGGMRGRGGPRGRGRARGGAPNYRDRTPVNPRGSEWPERGSFERYPSSDYNRTLPITERNDCEIIVVSKALTEYAEYIESRLKRLGIVVDLLFPMEDVPIGKVLGNIASRGCLYAILVMPQNEENKSLTLTFLHGLPQEHRNMPLEDALQLLSRNFQEVQQGGSSGREAVYALLGQLADGRSLTVLQYDKVIEYLQDRKEHQIKIELGEPMSTTTSSKAQNELQQRILSILNEKKALPPKDSSPVPAPAPAVPPSSQDVQNKFLNDPTLRKALNSILQKYS